MPPSFSKLTPLDQNPKPSITENDVLSRMDPLLLTNWLHADIQGTFFKNFQALVQEIDDEVYVSRMMDYVRLMKSKYMFVRVERPKGSRKFVIGYIRCELAFSFLEHFEKMRLRLNRVPPTLLTKMEMGENNTLRLACVGQTDYERAIEPYRNYKYEPPLISALRDKNEDAAEALLDGGDDPNEVDIIGKNALHIAAREGCSLPLFHRILSMIHNVNAATKYGKTALMKATALDRLDMVVSLMNHPGIDLNVQDEFTMTALHHAVFNNCPAIVAQLVSEDRIDRVNTSLKAMYIGTPLNHAIHHGYAECVKILREHGAPEE